MVKTCLYCNKQFETNDSRKIFCSHKCGLNHNRREKRVYYTKKCKLCGSEFVTNLSRKIFCNHDCEYEYNKNNKKESEKRCKYCDSIFYTNIYNKIYCCCECRNKAKREEFVEDKNIYINGFDEINSYIFGLIMSDGCLSYDIHSKRERIDITLNDYDILKTLKDYININRNIYKNNNSYKLIYINQDAINFLKEHGLTQRKSLTNPLPDMKIEHMSHFIRGYFDGDGSISIRKTIHGDYRVVSFVSGSMEFLDKLYALFKSFGWSCNIYNESANRVNSNSKYVIITKQKHIREFYDYIYKNCNIFYLKRKNEKFQY